MRYQLSGRRYWLIGASEGLGRAVATRLSAAGAELVLSARSAERLEDLALALPSASQVVTLDASDDASVAQAAQTVGEIDGVIYLAGLYWPMTAGEWDSSHATSMADVNFTGAIRILGQVLPAMVARDNGHVVLTGSLTAYRGLPGSIGYTASKAGVLSLAECLHADLGGSGVRVQVVNPGFIRTRLTDKNDFSMPFLMEPEEAADIIVAHMQTARFKRNFPRRFGLLFQLALALPDSLYYRLFGSKT